MPAGDYQGEGEDDKEVGGEEEGRGGEGDGGGLDRRGAVKIGEWWRSGLQVNVSIAPDQGWIFLLKQLLRNNKKYSPLLKTALI